MRWMMHVECWFGLLGEMRDSINRIQPPMYTIVRVGGAKSGSLIRCPSSLSFTTEQIASDSSSSLAPARNISRKSWSSLLKRQVRSLPSAVTRIREQCPQNGCVTGAIKPISPAPPSSNRYLRAVSLLPCGICTNGHRA